MIPITMAGTIVATIGCGDSAIPTGPAPNAEASLAAGSAPSIVKSVTGLEPLLDASHNVGLALHVSDIGQVVGTSLTNSIGSQVDHAVIWEGSTFAHDLGTLSGPTILRPPNPKQRGACSRHASAILSWRTRCSIVRASPSNER
jgi:probable HAF family extracellular repeat protein